METFELNTEKRIRLGIWGLGRGMSFFHTCEALGIDVVAGCDYNAHMREGFLKACPDAYVTEDAEAFLAYDMDAVLVATFSTEHCDDSIRALQAGKHVLAEVTAFHTMDQGVRLVEAVEASGLIYNMAENYPFTAQNMFLADQYQKGLFGELQYAEFEYVHNCLPLAYTYIDGTPIQPGNAVHYWRSWIHFHYYNTHSLGPLMCITGLRPTRVVSLPSAIGVPGFLDPEYQAVASSLITMSNGGLMRNFMGATASDTHSMRLWGATGAAENSGAGLHLKLGGGHGISPRLKVTPTWPKGSAELVEKTGHGGGDFWVLYYFARQIREGIPGPFDVYTAADCTAAGILAYRSAVEGGTPYDIPDFHNPSDRERWRGDHFAQTRYDVAGGCFPADADQQLTHTFSSTMAKLIGHANTYRALEAWATLNSSLAEAEQKTLRETHSTFSEKLPEIQATYRQARTLVDAYPDSDGARVLRQMLELGGEPNVLAGRIPG